MQVPRPKLATSKLAGKNKNEKKVEPKKKTLQLFYNEITYCFKTNKKQPSSL